jgi:predicted O-linked N-acetylglucosamine transferase (SPINDLY family)
MSRFEEAIPDCEAVLKADPKFKYARGNLVHAHLHCADWATLAQDKAEIEADLQAGRLTLHPLQNILLSDSSASLLKSAQLWVANECLPAVDPLWRGQRYAHDRIRVGYLSADFRQHAVATLSAGVFEHHDTARFETVGLSIGPDDGSAMRRRMEQAFGRFVDLRDMGDAEAAKLIHEMELDLLVDLNGFTQHARTPILARRPAGLQVNYLGFPGTMGALYIDYIIADGTIIPESQQSFFQEKIAYLPHSYLPNDASRARPRSAPSRS